MATNWSNTQNSKIFWFAVKSHDGFMAKPAVWHNWLQTANAFNNKCNGRSSVAVNSTVASYHSDNARSKTSHQWFAWNTIKIST